MKRNLSILFVLMVALVATSCGAPSGQETTSTTGATTTEMATETTSEMAAATADNYYPVTIQNYNQAKEAVDVTFDKAPEKVLAVYQDSIETLLALGLEDRIVAAAGLDQDVKSEYKEAFDKINYLTEFSPDKESVLALEPDMVLSWSSYFSDKKLGDVDYWHDNGIGTYMMKNSGAAPERKLQNEYDDIITIGKIFNVQDKAQAIVDEMKTEVDKIVEISNQMETKPRVLVMEIEKEDIRVYGDNTLGGDMVKAIGADLVMAPENRMSSEQLITENPDVIFTVYFGSSSSVEDMDSAIAKIVDEPKYASLSAVQNGKVHAISLGEIYCSGTRTLDGIKSLAKGIYPEFAE